MIYFIITILLILLELTYFRIAEKFNIIDKPNLRGSSSRITLRGGGVIFPLSIVLYCIFFGLSSLWFIISLLLISIISFIDDVHSVSNRIRFSIHLFATFMIAYQWGILNVDSWWMIVLTVILCTGIINAFNFMDGINGITGGYGLAVLAPLIYLNSKMNFIDQHLVLVFGISLFVFCFFNFRKTAKCFAGDVGSISVAFILIFIIGKLILQTKDFYWIMLMAIYGIDTSLTICHRIILKENLAKAHRKHLFQLMANELKIPHILVSFIYMFTQLLISCGLIFLEINKWIYSLIILTLFCTIYIIFMKKYYYLHIEYLKSKIV